MSKEITAVIIAGGMGARMGDLTSEQQKCMLPVDGKPILGYILDNLQEAFGSARVIVATGHCGETIKETYGSRYRNLDIEYVHSPERLETRRRLLLAEDLVDGPFLFLAGDIVADPAQFLTVAETYEKERGSGILGVISAAADHSPALSHAIITAKNGRAVELVYPPPETWTEDQAREMQIAYYDHGMLYLLKNAHPNQKYLSKIISDAINQGVDVAVEKYFKEWYHFAKPQDLQARIRYSSLNK